MNAPLSEDELAKIKAELVAGRKIDAIKLYRTATGSGLAEATTAIDQLEQDLRANSPDQFTSPIAKSPDPALPRYRWPWFVLALFVLAVALAFAWMSREVQRTRQIRDANLPSPAQTNLESAPTNPSGTNGKL